MARTTYDQPLTEDVPPPQGYLPPPNFIPPPTGLPPGTQWLRQQSQLRQASQLGYPQNMIDAAKQKYPILQRYNNNLNYKYTPKGPHTHLETWSPGEDAANAGMDPNKYGVEIYDTNIEPDMIAGDAIIHGIRNLDPQLKAMYGQFEQSVRNNPEQMARMRQRYKSELGKDVMGQGGETEGRNFEKWFTISELPQYFGSGFWDPNGVGRDWTPEQKQIWNRVRQYITSGAK